MRGRLRLILGGALVGAFVGAVGAAVLSRVASRRRPSWDTALARREASLDLRRLVSLGVSAVRLIRQVLEL